MRVGESGGVQAAGGHQAEHPAGPADLVIRDAFIVTMAEESMLIPRGSVIVRGDTIAALVGEGQEGPYIGPGTRVIDARDTVVMPGLINTHNHAAMTLFRGFADDLPLKKWLFEKIFPAEARILSSERVYWGALLACLEMLGSGTTCVADGYFFQDATARAVLDSGMRGLVAQGIIDFPAPGVPDPAENLNQGKAFIERWAGRSERIVPGLFCHSPITCSEKTLQGAMEISRQHGLPLQLHLSETREEVEEVKARSGLLPAAALDRIGLLAEDLIAVHAVHLEAAEMDLLQDRRVRLVHVPESNMKLACGVAPVPEMIRRGLRVGLGTDGACSNNDLDLFREMDTAAKLAKVAAADPVTLTAREVVKMATAWGASVLGLEKKIGTLAPGKQADLIILDRREPHWHPLYDVFSALVYAADGADVRDVVVAGEVVVERRRHTRGDAREVMARVRAVCRDTKH